MCVEMNRVLQTRDSRAIKEIKFVARSELYRQTMSNLISSVAW